MLRNVVNGLFFFFITKNNAAHYKYTPHIVVRKYTSSFITITFGSSAMKCIIFICGKSILMNEIYVVTFCMSFLATWTSCRFNSTCMNGGIKYKIC